MDPLGRGLNRYKDYRTFRLRMGHVGLVRFRDPNKLLEAFRASGLRLKT